MTERKMEHKTFPALVTKADEEQGIIETVFAVFGNVDEGDDVVHPGAFTKTFTERGHKVRVLDNHQADSILRTLGKPLILAEIGREQLPPKILERAPEATGGAFARIQFNMKTANGRDAFFHLQAGDTDEWSFGYDVLDYDYSKAERGGDEITVRNLRTLKLYEISPVLFAMNPATATTAAKENPHLDADYKETLEKVSEAKPWDTFPIGGEYCVFRVDAEGDRVGEALGCHDTEAGARQQVEALYAAEPEAGGKGDGEEAGEEKAITDEDKRVLQREIRALNMRDLVATHRRLHNMSAQGNTLTGFSRADMNWFHAACEAELRRRAEEDDREPPEASPLEWGKAEGEAETPDDEDEKHMPGRVGVIARREKDKAMDPPAQLLDAEETTHGSKAPWDSTIESLMAESYRLGLKEGRVLSTANANRIKTAVTALLEALGSAGIDIMEERGKAGPPPGEAPTSEEAGPQDEAAPTGEMLKLIEIEQEQMSMMEV